MIRLLFLISILTLNACSPELQSQKIISNDEEILYGSISKEQLYFDFPEWKEEQESYKPLPAITKQINKINEPVKVTIFLVTWCSDSRYIVPAFFKCVDQNANITYDIWAVNREKRLDNNLYKKYELEKVPTFIFEVNGLEIGRIVEYPQNLIEEDIVNILKNI